MRFALPVAGGGVWPCLFLLLQQRALARMNNLPTATVARWTFAILLAVALPLWSEAATGQPTSAAAIVASDADISVDLASGRTLTGALDARTTAAELWLRASHGGAELLRPIRWDRVVSAEVAGCRLTGEEIHHLIVQLREEIPAEPVVPPAKTSIVMVGQLNGAAPITNPAAEPLGTHRVVSLAIDARAARWDANVEPDGLLVHVYPLDADGAVVPVRGTLNVDLKTQCQGRHRLTDPFLDAGHWTEAVNTADFGPSGAAYRLRFQAISPEFLSAESSRRVAPRGLVHACLAVPGQGTFEASDDMAVLRPLSTVRNHLEAVTRHGDFPGYRYFDNERTDNGRH